MFIEGEKNSQTFQDSENTLKPNDELEVSKIIQDLYKNNLPTEIIGSGSKRQIGKKLQCAKTLELSFWCYRIFARRIIYKSKSLHAHF